MCARGGGKKKQQQAFETSPRRGKASSSMATHQFACFIPLPALLLLLRPARPPLALPSGLRNSPPDALPPCTKGLGGGRTHLPTANRNEESPSPHRPGFNMADPKQWQIGALSRWFLRHPPLALRSRPSSCVTCDGRSTMGLIMFFFSLS